MRVGLADVRQALDNEELVPCFQPMVQIHTNRLVGFEVLARWRHPRLGLVLPDNFISLAENNGLAGSLMEQILRKALLLSSGLRDPLGMAVNVSPTQLHDLIRPSTNRGNDWRFHRSVGHDTFETD
jgi:EAL domain-containing protein (putative c-di-GMP-specific phosphodiesterase class I)